MTEQPKDVVLPCPFCGTDRPMCGWAVGGAPYFIECRDCPAVIEEDTDELAIAAWNTRTPSPTAAPDEERVADPWKPDPDDPFWMLEVRQGFDDAGSWLKNDQTYLTTREPTKALRYPSRWAADCARGRLPLSEGHKFEPTDHLWIASTPTPREPDDALALRIAREAVIDIHTADRGKLPMTAPGVLAGQFDDHWDIRCAKRAVELAMLAASPRSDVLPRNPTPEMLMAGRKQCAADCLGPHMGPNVERIWQVMHDASTGNQSSDGGVK